jgi:phage gp36-like protein
MYVTLEAIQKALSADVLVYLVDDERERALTPAGLERVDQAIRDANGEVDSYIGQRYVLPLPFVPDVLASQALNIARYKLFLRRGIREGTADESVVTAYRDAVKWLEKIATGKASLPIPDGSGGSNGTVQNPSKASISGPGRIFSRETLEDW